MWKGPKRRKYVSDFYRKVLARNVSDLAAATYRGERNIPQKLSSETGFSRSTVQRLMAGEDGASIDLIDRIARALDVHPYQLLLPNLDVRNPQVVRGALPGESSVYRNIPKPGISQK